MIRVIKYGSTRDTHVKRNLYLAMNMFYYSMVEMELRNMRYRYISLLRLAHGWSQRKSLLIFNQFERNMDLCQWVSDVYIELENYMHQLLFLLHKILRAVCY